MVRGYLRRAQKYKGGGPAECCVGGVWLRLDVDVHDVDEEVCEDRRGRLVYPRCPDCNGELERREAGELDNKRSCPGCGSLFEYRPYTLSRPR